MLRLLNTPAKVHKKVCADKDADRFANDFRQIFKRFQTDL